MAKIKVDQLLRVHIPNKVAEDLSISAGDSLNYVLEGDRIVLVKEDPEKRCPVCNRVFPAEYQFCPYDGQYVNNTSNEIDGKEKFKMYKEVIENVMEHDAYVKELLKSQIDKLPF